MHTVIRGLIYTSPKRFEVPPGENSMIYLGHKSRNVPSYARRC